MKVLMEEKHVTLNESYTITYIKTGMNIDLQEFLLGVFVMKAAINQQQVFFKTIMNHIPNNIIINSKLINLKENQDINISVGSGQKHFSYKVESSIKLDS